MGSKRTELIRPIGLGFFLKSLILFGITAGAIAGLAPMQPDIEKFVLLVKKGRWNLILLAVVWLAGHLVIECVRRKLELDREALRSSPKKRRVTTKRAPVKAARKQHLKTRG